MICPQCHLPNSDTAVYCAKCGKMLGQASSLKGGPIVASTGDTICPHCRTMNKNTSQFCKKCGSAIPPAVLPNSQQPFPYPQQGMPNQALYPSSGQGDLSYQSQYAQVPPQTRRIGPDQDLPLRPSGTGYSNFVSSVGIAHPEQPHCPLILLLDVSGSMEKDNKIQQLNAGIQLFRQEIMRDELASRRVDVSIVTFGDCVSVVTPFTAVSQFNPPLLIANGLTPMGEAIEVSLNLVEQRKQQYKQQGIDYFRPWVFMITDGEPNDMAPGDATWNRVVGRVHTAERDNKVLFFTVGIEPANMDILRQITPSSRVPIKLIPGNFSEMFQWLSNSQEKVVRQDLGAKTANFSLDPPVGWGTVTYQ